MDTAAVMQQCLIDLDVVRVRKLWAHLAPHLPQDMSDQDALTALHVARTAAESIPLKLRAYSHRWCLERNVPSQLPDKLKPKAERIYPRVVDAVGVAVSSKYAEVKQAIGGAMSYAVLDCYANGDTDPRIVKPRMHEARVRERKALGLPKLPDDGPIRMKPR